MWICCITTRKLDLEVLMLTRTVIDLKKEMLHLERRQMKLSAAAEGGEVVLSGRMAFMSYKGNRWWGAELTATGMDSGTPWTGNTVLFSLHGQAECSATAGWWISIGHRCFSCVKLPVLKELNTAAALEEPNAASLLAGGSLMAMGMPSAPSLASMMEKEGSNEGSE
ncbi:hypothetical protein P4O66_002751 [Electrophorus voltai]|uniref:Uncharacterized protein n=1 Tax=Electrophorus voltai TaxID=2609070 RepID=A0AAD9DND5_9TELE|nr:hypothetical protein P4O66_002751 [Electrophorus voltai]